VRLHGSINSSPASNRKRFSLIGSRAVPALIAAILFFMSGGDLIIIALAFALLIWSFFAAPRTRRNTGVQQLAVASAETPDFLRAGIEWCRAMSGAKRVVLWSVDEPAGLVRPIGAAGGAWPNVHVLHGSPVTWIAREQISARIAPPPEWAETLRVMGVAVLQAQAAHALTLELIDDIDVKPEQFEALGIYMGALLNLLEDQRVLADHQDRSELLIDALRALPTATDAASLARELVGFAVRVTRGDGAALVAYQDESAELVAAEGAGLQAGSMIADTQSLAILAARGGATLVKHGAALRALNMLAEQERISPTPEAATAVPLITDNELVGVLIVWSARPIEQAAISTLETLAPYAGARLQHARELGAMRVLADRDALSGLSNRRAFDAQLAGEWARSERYSRPFAVLLFDVDHFKRINDHHGHDAGDEVLRAISAALTKQLRGSDFAARYGGEEFAVILPEASGRIAVEIAERIRSRIETLPIAYHGQPIPVTISGGVTASADHMSATDMIRIADQLLYRAKANGRNRIEFDSSR
jgi:diguanylate cyclase (GGDEF)-like protein